MMTRKHTILSLLCIFACYSCVSFAFEMSSSEFYNQDIMPTINTCDGRDISPDIHWQGTPSKTASFALILSDLDAPSGVFYHWIVFNIPANINAFPAAIASLPAGTLLGKTSWGVSGYKGPCPPKGQSHRYVFSLYALNTMLSLPADSEAPVLLAAMQNHILGEADLKVTYERK